MSFLENIPHDMLTDWMFWILIANLVLTLSLLVKDKIRRKNGPKASMNLPIPPPPKAKIVKLPSPQDPLEAIFEVRQES